MDSALFQDWITIGGQGNASTDTILIQSEPFWLDLAPFRDIVGWLEVSNWSADAGLQLSYQTAVSKDEALFATIGTPVPLVVGVTVTQMLSAYSALGRFFRWQVAPTAHTTNAWSATFRIFLALNRPGDKRRAHLQPLAPPPPQGPNQQGNLPKVDVRPPWEVPQSMPKQVEKPLKVSPWITK